MDAGRIIDVACRPWPGTRAVQAERILSRVCERDLSHPLRSRATNARGGWSVIANPAETNRARDLFKAAHSIDPTSRAAAANLAAVLQEDSPSAPPVRIATVSLVSTSSQHIDPHRSLTLARMLRRAGYDVMHLIVKIAGAPLPTTIDIPHQIIDLQPFSCEPDVKSVLADSLRPFNPDLVLLHAPAIYLPILAAAVSEFPFVLGSDAVDLCPLLEGDLDWVRELARASDSLLHRAGTIGFDDQMRQAIWDADEVLVCTPEAQMRLAPHARSVRVVPWGIDPAVFTDRDAEHSSSAIRLCVVLTKDATETKRFGSALRQLSNSSEPDSIPFVTTVFSPSTSLASEPSQRAELLQSADIILFPEEEPSAESAALIGEAMSCGRPVVVPQNESTRYLLSDGVEGMMFEPAHPKHLSRVVRQLASDATLRRELGAAARRAAVRRFDWQVIIERGYRPILRHRVAHKNAT